MDIEQTLKDIAEYFQNKVINGDFEFKSCDEYRATVLIDGKHEIEIWIANEPKDNLRLYDGWAKSLDLSSRSFTTQKQRLAGWKQIKPYIKEYNNKVLLKKKEKEYNDLKKQIEKLNES